MKALTIRQPWADAIAHQTKRVENRTWKTNYRGPVLIHAAAAHDPHATVYGPRPDLRSAVIAIASIADCHWSDDGKCCGPWGEERVYHWALTDVISLAKPLLEVKGRLGIWTPDADLIEAMAALDTPTAETTPGYAIALAAAEHEAHEQYVHQLATELIETTEASQEATQ